MSFYTDLIQKIILPIADRILGVEYFKTYRNWKQLELKSCNEINQLQHKRLQKLLKHAIKTVPGYLNLPAKPILSDFPIATKSMYRNSINSWISNNFRKQDLIIEKSSGSSGVQGQVYMSKQEWMLSLSHQTYLWSWAGYTPGDRLLQLGMTLDRGFLKKIKDYYFRTKYKQAFNLNETAVKETLHEFQGKQNKVFFGGYASGLYEYARIAQAHSINDVHFRSVISWGDKMFDHYRYAIETQFDCKVFDTYGTTEGFVIAGQCEQGSYHILTPHIYLEVVDEQGNEVPTGSWGHVLVTRLDAFAMPLIRYRLGDLAIKEAPEKRCSCERPFPMLRKIIGRDTDVIRTPSGKALIVHFFTGIFEHIEEIRQFQVVQESIDYFVIRYISDLTDQEIGTVLESAISSMNEKSGERLNVHFEPVQLIKPSPSGKPQIIISNLNTVS